MCKAVLVAMLTGLALVAGVTSAQACRDLGRSDRVAHHHSGYVYFGYVGR